MRPGITDPSDLRSSPSGRPGAVPAGRRWPWPGGGVAGHTDRYRRARPRRPTQAQVPGVDVDHRTAGQARPPLRGHLLDQVQVLGQSTVAAMMAAHQPGAASRPARCGRRWGGRRRCRRWWRLASQSPRQGEGQDAAEPVHPRRLADQLAHRTALLASGSATASSGRAIVSALSAHGRQVHDGERRLEAGGGRVVTFQVATVTPMAVFPHAGKPPARSRLVADVVFHSQRRERPGPASLPAARQHNLDGSHPYGSVWPGARVLPGLQVDLLAVHGGRMLSLTRRWTSFPRGFAAVALAPGAAETSASPSALGMIGDPDRRDRPFVRHHYVLWCSTARRRRSWFAFLAAAGRAGFGRQQAGR